MKDEGPELEALLHRLGECPPEFLQVAADKSKQGIDVVAIVCDLVRSLTPNKPPEPERELLARIAARSANELALISIASWLLSYEWFLARPALAPVIWKLLSSDDLARLAQLIRPDKFVNDADRREEFARTCLHHLGLRPQGESLTQAADRLTTLDSAERDRVLRATAAAERRAREVREAMARQKAQEAASRYGE